MNEDLQRVRDALESIVHLEAGKGLVTLDQLREGQRIIASALLRLILSGVPAAPARREPVPSVGNVGKKQASTVSRAVDLWMMKHPGWHFARDVLHGVESSYETWIPPRMSSVRQSLEASCIRGTLERRRAPEGMRPAGPIMGPRRLLQWKFVHAS